MAEAVPCEFVEQLRRQNEAQLTVSAAYSRGPLDGVPIKVTDKSGREFNGQSPATFNGLADGDAIVEAVLTPEQDALYLASRTKVAIARGSPQAVVLKLPTKKIEVKLKLDTTRSRAVLEGSAKKPAPVKVEACVDCGNPDAMKLVSFSLFRSPSTVKVFTDEEMTKELAFQSDLAKLDPAPEVNKPLPLWALPADAKEFSLELRGEMNAGKLAPAKVEFEEAIEFLSGGRFLHVVDSFETVSDVLGSYKRIKSLAALADMKASELANFAIKRLFIRKGVLEQPVVVKIDGAQVELKHPQTGGKLPLLYSDFIVDRSGPKFLGALDADVAVETLMYKDSCISTLLAKLKKDPAGPKAQSFYDSNLIHMVRDNAKRRFDKLKAEKPSDYPALTKNEVDAATSVFEHKHMAQRKLSDFDLTARETETLSRAIGAVLKDKLGKEVPEKLMLHVGSRLWSEGGPIESRYVKQAIDESGGDVDAAIAKYGQIVAADKRFVLDPKVHNGTGYRGGQWYHILIDEVGAIACRLLEGSEPRVDAGYGLGIPYYAQEVEEGHGKLEPHGKKEEIGDIICDETSHYGTVFSHNKNIDAAFRKLGRGYEGLDARKNLRENCRAIVKGTAAEKDYKAREAFIDSMLMFEQISKKEAQAQLFKVKKNTSKLMGNVSDVSQFLYGVDICLRVAKSNGRDDEVKRLEAFKEVVTLSCLVAFPRWGINAGNLSSVDDTAGQISKEQFADSINERSYGHLDDYDSPRVHVEWAKIDAVIAKQRLDDYKSGMKPIWELIRGQGAYFAAMDELIKAVTDKAPRKTARDKVRGELSKVLDKLPNLKAQIGGDVDALLDALAGQCEESAQFQYIRTKPKE